MKKKQIEAALLHFKKHDPILAGVCKSVGELKKRKGSRDAFTRLCRAILGQQLSVRATNAVWERLNALYAHPGRLLPQDILDTSVETLRACGMSHGKIRSLKDLARHFYDKRIDPRRFPRLSDEDIIITLVQVHGIGVWSAQMYLIFGLGRPGVLPVGDLGFRNALQKAYRLRTHPTEKKIRILAKNWGPYASIAALYLWEYKDTGVWKE